MTDQLNGLFILRATPPYDAPAPPQSVTAERVAPNNHVSLSWHAVLNARGYTVERSFDGSSYSVIAKHLISTSYVDSDASRQDAHYIVKALNGEGSGTSSVVTSPKCVSDQDCDCSGTCEAGESCNSCPYDCFGGTTGAAECPNGVCEAGDGEDCLSRPEDCNGVQSKNPSDRFCCGDGDGEYPVTCDDSRCSTCTNDPVVLTYCCGDSTCEEGLEDSTSCALDCSTTTITTTSTTTTTTTSTTTQASIPSKAPTGSPTSPTHSPTDNPSKAPTGSPTQAPTPDCIETNIGCDHKGSCTSGCCSECCSGSYNGGGSKVCT